MSYTGPGASWAPPEARARGAGGGGAAVAADGGRACSCSKRWMMGAREGAVGVAHGAPARSAQTAEETVPLE
jgi:hypothetical protein